MVVTRSPKRARDKLPSKANFRHLFRIGFHIIDRSLKLSAVTIYKRASQVQLYHSLFLLVCPTYSCFISGMSCQDVSPPDTSLCVQTSPHARAKQKIAALMEEVEILRQNKATKQRYAHHFSTTKSGFDVSSSLGRQPIMFHRDEQFDVWWPFTVL